MTQTDSFKEDHTHTGQYPRLPRCWKIVSKTTYEIPQNHIFSLTQSHARDEADGLTSADAPRWLVALPKSPGRLHIVLALSPLPKALMQIFFRNGLHGTEHILWNTPRGGKPLPFCGWIYFFFFLIFNFGIIIDSHTVTRNNAEMSYLSFTQFPLDDNILQNHSTTSQPEYWPGYSQNTKHFHCQKGISQALL